MPRYSVNETHLNSHTLQANMVARFNCLLTADPTLASQDRGLMAMLSCMYTYMYQDRKGGSTGAWAMMTLARRLVVTS